MNKNRVCISGINGQLGSAFRDYFVDKAVFCMPFDRALVKSLLPEQVVRKYLEDNRITTFIHCAANTDVEFCEKNLDKCLEDNVNLTSILTTACTELHVRFVFVSSTGVYGDYASRPYSENDLVIPTTNYHRSKVLAENLLVNNKNALILRVGWLFGRAASTNKNFILNRLREAKSSDGSI